MTVVRLGNRNPQMQHPVLHPETGEQIGQRFAQAKHLNQSVTRLEMAPNALDPEHAKLALSTDNDRQLSNIGQVLGEQWRYAIAIQHIEHVIELHAAGTKPSWVECDDDEGLAQAIASYYSIPVGQQEMLLTYVGRDKLHAQHMSNSQPAPFRYMALTASTTAPDPNDTALAGEIATPSGGLIRALGTFAHTAGTNVSTLSNTFTANGSDVLPVTVAQIGILNATPSGGDLAYHTALSSTATPNFPGDNLTITESVAGG